MEPTVPDRITGHAREAWESIASSLPAERNLSRAELLTLEAACRAFARWRSLEDAIEDLRRKQPLAAELTRSAKGDLQPSAIRQAASEAFAEYDRLISGLDLGARRSAAPGFDRDLFGDPVRVPGRRGRPQHVPTQRNRDKVVMLLALGWSDERIAHALMISLPTLRKHYRPELKAREVQRDRLDARRFEQVFEQAEGGNVGAQRLLQQMIEKNDLMGASAKLADAQARRAKAEAKSKAPVGKKEAAQQAAAQAAGEDSGDWGGDLAVPGFGRPN